ncbi:MAG: ABC transporter permease [Tepidisphaeraceae bacterium]
MWAYIARRILWTIPIALGIVILTFCLFTYVAPDPARLLVGKYASPEKLEAQREKMGLNKPRWFDFAAVRRPAQSGRPAGIAGVIDTQFFDTLLWRLPDSEHYHKPLTLLIAEKGPISLSIQLPIFIIELGVQLILALICAQYRGRWPDTTITFGAVVGMCVPALSMIVFFQWLLGFKLGLFPVAGWGGLRYAAYFGTLPIIVGVLSGIGGGTRFYRSIMLEEIYADYIRTARAKGVGQSNVLLVHVLRNAMVPVITRTVASLPFLILGALIVERMFQIPGLGYVLVEAIENQDRSIVLGMTYLVSLVYCVMLLVTDICYMLVDPRVKLQ